MQSLGSIPEQGQLAVVRQRRYVVTDVRIPAKSNSIAGPRLSEQTKLLSPSHCS
jgi:hypothetical protein